MYLKAEYKRLPNSIDTEELERNGVWSETKHISSVFFLTGNNNMLWNIILIRSNSCFQLNTVCSFWNVPVKPVSY